MLYWIIDNKIFVLGLLALVAGGFAFAWWQTRKKPWLIGGGVSAALLVVVVVLSLLIVTDQEQIERNIDSMRNALNAGKPEEASKYFDDEVNVELANNKTIKLTNKALEELARYNMSRYGVKTVETGGIKFEELSRPKAVVSFMVRAEDNPATTGRCRMEFVLTPQGKWRVKAFTVESFIGGQKSPALIWIGGGVPGV